METIALDELRALLDDGAEVRVVMTLGPHRFNQAHIPGTETFPTVEAALEGLAPDEDIVLYCAGVTHPASTWGHRILTSRGYQNVRVFTGGLVEWSAAGLPLDTTEDTAVEVVA